MSLSLPGWGCGESVGPTDSVFTVSVISGPTTVLQGQVWTFGASVTGEGAAAATVDWSVEPAWAGRIETDGRFVAYETGPATIVALVGAARGERTIDVFPRRATGGSISVVGQGAIADRYTSDLWVNGSVAYTGTWSTRDGAAGPQRGDALYVWDVSNPAAPVLTDSIIVAAGTINDVKIRDDGALAVISHEGELPNGITLLDLADPLHPTILTRLTDTMEAGVHNLWLEGDFIYAVVDGSDPASGLRVIDAADPSNPQVVATFYGGSPASNFGQFLHDVHVRDGLAFLAHWDPGLIILDVGNGIMGGAPQNPIEVSRIQTAGGDTHNAWYWPESGYVFVGEEDFSTPGVLHVVDASDLTAPKEVATFSVPGTTPHNVWLDETTEILYVAWYAAGLFAIDVSGELLGDLDRQGRVLATSLYGGVGACQTSGTCAWAPQLHQGHIWVADLNSGLWSLRFGF